MRCSCPVETSCPWALVVSVVCSGWDGEPEPGEDQGEGAEKHGEGRDRAVEDDRRGEKDEAARLAEGERPQQHLVEETEDRRVGTDPRGERCQGDDRKQGAPPQRAEHEPEILRERCHRFVLRLRPL